MSIAIVIKSGEGALFPNHDKSKPNDPILTGFLKIPLDENKKNVLTLDVAVWTKNNGKDYYSLSVGGIPATMFKEEKKKDADSPDYAGSFGVGREMRISGWRKQKDGRPYISIALVEKTGTRAGQEQAAPEQVPTPPQENGQRQPEQPDHSEGVPGFDFI